MIGHQISNSHSLATPTNRTRTPSITGQLDNGCLAVCMATDVLDGFLELTLSELADERLAGGGHDHVVIVVLLTGHFPIGRKSFFRVTSVLQI